MHKPLIKLSVIAALVLSANAAFALEYRSVARHGAVLSEAPGDEAKKLFLASKGMPLELLAEQGDWARVRDKAGSLAWLRKKDLSTKHTVQVLRDATIYKAADAKSAIIYRAGKDLLLDLQENTRTGWLKVKHRDGASGFIRIEEVWGV
ncbi:SH3 domain-containing protein [Iodobacter sp. HSC-16F04]|uniref:SH3 domain-containing protein n=1 Tax=Iodobacter violaceini TaxID=3044271 RepID=A0ABX0KKF0_9NEIS|nr:SH3 domain-containing protein [Iodobacter violacea]NHQ84506.1 SH3 domain-containing protein [Iodobacter violacea]